MTYFPDRGFGFIRPTGQGVSAENVFFHRTDLPLEYQRGGSETLAVGMVMEFTMGMRRGNAVAIDVRPVVMGDDSALQTGVTHVGK